MATKIETLKKPNGDHVLPRTRAKAVSMENGTTVEAAIGDINANIDQLPAWAKEPTKPTYTASEVGALPADTVIPSIDGLATETYVNTQLASLVNSAPDKLNTLDELAAALGDDENFANTMATSLSNKLDKSELNAAINAALAQAKASGEFDGEQGEIGPAGYSPVRGTDYWTDEDIAEIKSYVDEVATGSATTEGILPEVSEMDNGAFLCVVNGQWSTFVVPHAEEVDF